MHSGGAIDIQHHATKGINGRCRKKRESLTPLFQYFTFWWKDCLDLDVFRWEIKFWIALSSYQISYPIEHRFEQFLHLNVFLVMIMRLRSHVRHPLTWSKGTTTLLEQKGINILWRRVSLIWVRMPKSSEKETIVAYWSAVPIVPGEVDSGKRIF